MLFLFFLGFLFFLLVCRIQRLETAQKDSSVSLDARDTSDKSPCGMAVSWISVILASIRCGNRRNKIRRPLPHDPEPQAHHQQAA